jgi:hypothetical protein
MLLPPYHLNHLNDVNITSLSIPWHDIETLKWVIPTLGNFKSVFSVKIFIVMAETG